MTALLCAVACGALVAGCATRKADVDDTRRFDISRDAFAFDNELRSTYAFDSEGRWVRTPIEPVPEFSLRCFPVARAARQFFDHAVFLPDQEKLADARYASRIREVFARSSRTASPTGDRVQFPGYASLREFSTDHGEAIKAACGSALESYTQRGHWRMVMPFSQSGQAKRAEAIAERVEAGRPVIVHVVDFPSLWINHAVLLTAVARTPDGFQFAVYDPNDGATETVLEFDRAARTFRFPQTLYFRGGAVDAYEVYRDWLY